MSAHMLPVTPAHALCLKRSTISYEEQFWIATVALLLLEMNLPVKEVCVCVHAFIQPSENCCFVNTAETQA